MIAPILAAMLLLLAVVAPASAGTLDRVRDQGVFRIGYRTDAVPFAYNNPSGQPTGYVVDLCRAVAADLKRQLRLANLKVDYVPVTAENGFAAVKDGQVDILCGPTTQSLARRDRLSVVGPHRMSTWPSLTAAKPVSAVTGT